jgi:hypothetical protein
MIIESAMTDTAADRRAPGQERLRTSAARATVSIAVFPALALFVIGIASHWLPRPAPPASRPIRSPVHGRWRAMNSPATKALSHGTHRYGETYALDLVDEPHPDARPRFGGARPLRDPREYPAFGAPVVAPVDGRVVAARDRARDHRCRTNLAGYGYMLLEGIILSLRGPTGLLGNHVTIAADDGTHVVLAHLQRGSLAVSIGERVVAGQRLGRAGNSGNSSEPYVHLQLMDRAAPSSALGQPFTLSDAVLSDAWEPPTARPSTPALPATDEFFHGGPLPRAADREPTDTSARD